METKIIPGLKGGPLMILECISDTSLSITINNRAIDYCDDLKSQCIDSFGPVVACTINCLTNQDVESCISNLENLCSADLPANHMIAMDLYDVESVLSRSKAGVYRTIEARPKDLKENTKQIVQSIKNAKPDMTGMIIHYEWDDPQMLKIILESTDVIPSIINDSTTTLITQAAFTLGKTEFASISMLGF